MGIMFLMTDAQVANEQFLVLVNDLLASGEVGDLFPDDEIENIIGGVRNEVNKLFSLFKSSIILYSTCNIILVGQRSRFTRYKRNMLEILY